MLVSCLPEKKLAQEFVDKRPSFTLVVQPPDFIYKYNHKGEEIDGFDTLSESQQDSALFYTSHYIKRVSDSVFLDQYINQFLEELRVLGFDVYLYSWMDSTLMTRPQTYLFSMAQLQLDEYTYLLEDRQYVGDSLYYKTVPLNAVDFSAWLELRKLDKPAAGSTVLYATHSVLDDFDGYFYADPWSMDVMYRYRLDTLSLENIYEMANVIGRRHAGYLFDFFMNQYVLFHLNTNGFAPYYYHYNRQRDVLIQTDQDRFEILP